MATNLSAASAEVMLAERFEGIGNITKYIRAFRTRRGRELALERERDGIYLWTEQAEDRPSDLPAPEPYDAKRSRNSNLKSTTQRLGPGRPVWYWRLDEIGELERLCNWYAAA